MRVDDPGSAAFTVRKTRYLHGQKGPKTDEEIIREIRQSRNNKDWFTSEYWKKKGTPSEQVEFQINDREITVYNFNQEKPFGDEYIEQTKRAFGKLASRFPQILNKLRWVLIDDSEPPSVYGDPVKYPFNGQSDDKWRAFILYPRAMELVPHRVLKATNFEGTIVHELTHINANDFLTEWEGKYRWASITDDDKYLEEWESRLSPDGRMNRLFNKKTGEMSPWGQVPLSPDECVNFYAQITISEDICESMVAYIYDPELLKRVSPEKYGILSRHDAKGQNPTVTVTRVLQDAIKLPEVKGEIVKYYVKE